MSMTDERTGARAMNLTSEQVDATETTDRWGTLLYKPDSEASPAKQAWNRWACSNDVWQGRRGESGLMLRGAFIAGYLAADG